MDDDIKIGDMDKITPHRSTPPTEYIHHKPDSNGAGTIALAIIAAAVIGVGGWIGYIEYSAYSAKRQIELEAQAAKQRILDARERARRNAESRELYQQQNSADCRFWKLQNKNAPTTRTARKVKQHCPLG
ncbi:MAG: hypothetical protein ABGX87_10365 [Alcanivorax sp.]